MTDHRDKLRRLRILQRLAFVAPYPRSETALLADLLADPQLDPSVELVRKSLRYLAYHDLAILIGHSGSDWLAATVTESGKSWLKSPEDAGLSIYTLEEQPPPAPDNRRGRVSSIEVIPLEARFWLEAELIKNGFSDYSGLTKKLKKRGHRVSRSSLGRFAARLKQQFEKDRSETRKRVLGARYKVEALGDEIEVNRILRGMAQDELLSMLLAGSEGDPKALKKMVEMVRIMGVEAINAREYQIKEETRRKTIAEAASQVEDVARAQGLDDGQARFWREKFLKGM